MRFTLKIGRLVIFDVEWFVLNDPAPVIIQLSDDDDEGATDDRHII